MISINNIFADKAKHLYDVMGKLKQSTFDELKTITNFTDMDLCFAICSLIKLNKIYQKKVDDTVVYGIA